MNEPTTPLLQRAVDGLVPPEDLLDRIARRKAARLRRRRVGAAVVALLIAGVGFGGALVAFERPRSPETPATASETPRPPSSMPGMVTYRDAGRGYEIDRPARFRHGTFNGFANGVRSVWFANFSARFRSIEFPNNMPKDGVAVLIVSYEMLMPSVERTPDTAFPLSMRDLRWKSHWWRVANVVANGEPYLLWLHIGPDAPQKDREAAAAMIPSLTFLPLRTGTALEGTLPYFVLDHPDHFARGSVTRFDPADLPRTDTGRRAPFYLVRTDKGFYALAWPGQIVGGYQHCDVTYDASVGQFTCSNGARWALDGSVLAKPGPSYRDDPLAVLSVRLSLDGHVLVCPNLFLEDLAFDLRLTGG